MEDLKKKKKKKKKGVFHIDGSLPHTHPQEYVRVFARAFRICAEDEITLVINSPGGDIGVALGLRAAIHQSRNEGKRFVARIVGECSSSAIVVARACDTVERTPGARMVLHYVEAVMRIRVRSEDTQEAGTLRFLAAFEEAKTNSKAMEQALGTDTKGCCLLSQVLDGHSEVILTNDRSLRLGLVDRITNPGATQAS